MLELDILDSGLTTTAYGAAHQPVGDVPYLLPDPSTVLVLAHDGTPVFEHVERHPYLPRMTLWNLDGRVWRLSAADAKMLLTEDGIRFSRYVLTFEENR
ncbi:MAG: hypothetical protein INR66_14910 [Gordonia polyisoprenivorans]|nr:hypothetical protein [Gordonia polyisoprenivorans]